MGRSKVLRNSREGSLFEFVSEQGPSFNLIFSLMFGNAEKSQLTLSKLPLIFDISRSLSLDSWITLWFVLDVLYNCSSSSGFSA